MLIKSLPRTSALVRKVDPEGTAWTSTDYLLANVIDVLQAANWQRSNEGRDEQKVTPRPEPVPRPGDKGREDQQEQKLAALIAANRAHQAKGADK